MKIFSLTHKQHCPPYSDYFFEDHAKNSILRHWTLTIIHEDSDLEKRGYYATLQRAKTEESDFGEPVEMPRKIADVLMGLI